MKVLRLTIKKQWFAMIVSGEKTEEYREIKWHWFTRLVFKHESVIKYLNMKCTTEDVVRVLNDAFWVKTIAFKAFDSVEFINGYSPTSPRATFEFNGIEIKEGKPEWGAIKGEKYFTIKLGKQIFNPAINTVIKEEI